MVSSSNLLSTVILCVMLDETTSWINISPYPLFIVTHVNKIAHQVKWIN